jgi:prepilin-type processing-associated H-X9-DG protein
MLKELLWSKNLALRRTNNVVFFDSHVISILLYTL